MPMRADGQRNPSVRFPDQLAPAPNEAIAAEGGGAAARSIDPDLKEAESSSKHWSQFRGANDDVAPRQAIQIPCGAVGVIFAAADAIAILAASLCGALGY